MSTIARTCPMGTILITAAALSLTACSVPTPATSGAPAQPEGSPSATSTATTGGLGAAPAGNLGGAADPHPFPGQVDIGPAQPRADSDRNIYAVYDIRDGLTLRDGWFAATGKWSLSGGGKGDDRAGNGGVPNVIDKRYGWVSVWGWSPGFVYSHQIYRGGKPTGYWMGSKYASPETGSNSGSCDIYLGDPRQKGTWAPLSPYSCNWTNIRGWNPTPTVVLRSATQVTDPDEAADILTDNCNGSDNADRCTYVGITSTTALGKLQPRGSEVINNGETTAKKKISWEDEVGSETSIGVEVTNSFKLGELWKLEVKASVEHKWEYSHTFGEDIEQEVDGRTVAWAEFAPNYVAFLGSWVVDAKDGKRYLLPDVSLKSPLLDGGQVQVFTCPLKDYLGRYKCNVVPARVIVKP